MASFSKIIGPLFIPTIVNPAAVASECAQNYLLPINRAKQDERQHVQTAFDRATNFALVENFAIDPPTSKRLLHALFTDAAELEPVRLGEVMRPSAQSFLDQVPQRYRAHVRKMAQSAFDEGMGRNLAFPQFVEKMAECWLLKFSEFDRIARESGFAEITGELNGNTNSAVFVLTVNGSFVAATEPDARGFRNTAYIRIKMREPSRIPSFREGTKFGNSIKRGASVSIQNHLRETSEVIAVFASHADAEKVRVVTQTLMQSFIDVEHQTIKL